MKRLVIMLTVLLCTITAFCGETCINVKKLQNTHLALQLPHELQHIIGKEFVRQSENIYTIRKRFLLVALCSRAHTAQLHCASEIAELVPKLCTGFGCNQVDVALALRIAQAKQFLIDHLATDTQNKKYAEQYLDVLDYYTRHDKIDRVDFTMYKSTPCPDAQLPAIEMLAAERKFLAEALSLDPITHHYTINFDHETFKRGGFKWNDEYALLIASPAIVRIFKKFPSRPEEYKERLQYTQLPSLIEQTTKVNMIFAKTFYETLLESMETPRTTAYKKPILKHPQRKEPKGLKHRNRQQPKTKKFI